MTDTDTTDSDTDTDDEPTEYRLQEGIDRVVRAGLVLEAGETVVLEPGHARDHEDVLEPVADDTEPAADDSADEDQEAEA